MKKWGHDELAHDLAEHLSRPNRMVWEDMQLGPSGSPRPDVYTMQKSYTQPNPRAYEVKISVSDFRSDITIAKWQSYLKYAAGVTFCAPAGLISKADVPTGCGLMLRGEAGWRTARAPTLQRVTLPEDACLKLLIDGAERSAAAQRLKNISTHRANQAIRKKLGDSVADAIRDRDEMLSDADHALSLARFQADAILSRAQRVYDNEKARADKIVAAYDESYEQLRIILGLPEKSGPHVIINAARNFQNRNCADQRLATARDRIRSLIRAANTALEAVTDDEVGG